MGKKQKKPRRDWVDRGVYVALRFVSMAMHCLPVNTNLKLAKWIGDLLYRFDRKHRERALAKGDVLEVARLAGIMAAKKTSELIPLCHPLPITAANLEFAFEGEGVLHIEATVRVFGRTGVEMEALTAVSVAALTVYDMCKAVDKGMTIERIRLEEKKGGKSGLYRRQD